MDVPAAITRIPEDVLRPGDLAIDAGANVGDVTSQMRALGAEVHAFEPNSTAFAALADRFGADEKVHLHHAAVGAADGEGMLHLHESAADDPLVYSTGSSMCADKANVRRETGERVAVVDLARFVLELDRSVAMLKLDVEGLEAEVLERMLDTGAIDRVRLTLAESHEKKVPSVRAPLERVRARLAQRVERADGFGRVRFDWI